MVVGTTNRVVMDTAATMPIVGKDLMHLARNVRPLPHPVSLETANGLVEVTSQCDLPAPHGVMNNSLCVPSCARTLNPGVATCLKHGFGLVIDEGGATGRYVKGGVTMIELDLSGGMFGFSPSTVDDGSALFCVQSDLVQLHQQILSSYSAVAYISVSKDLARHYLDGHRHFSAQCPWCVQAKLRKKRAIRISLGGHSLESGYGVSCDFSGPFDPDVDGFTLALVVVEVRSSKGFVGLQTSRSKWVDTKT